MRWVIAILLIALVLPASPGLAQNELSKEEIELIDRVFRAVDKADAYSSFTASTTEFYILEMEISFFGQSIEFLESITSNSDGYVVRDDNGEQSSSTVTVSYASRSPQDNINYTVGADVITIDEILYVNASYIQLDTSLPPIEAGWQTYESADDIPTALEELQLDEVFESEEDGLLNRTAILVSATEVTIESGELSDGTPVDVIQMIVDENLVSFLNLDESDDIFGQILSEAELEGEIVFTASLDADDNVLLTNFSIMVSINDLDLGELEREEFPEGTTLDLSVDSTQIGTISNIDGEYQPIEVPVE